MAGYNTPVAGIIYTFLNGAIIHSIVSTKRVDKALSASEPKTDSEANYKLEIVPSKEMPELSIIDYLMWAVQRKLMMKENRYFDALRHKYETVLNLYEEVETGIK